MWSSFGWFYDKPRPVLVKLKSFFTRRLRDGSFLLDRYKQLYFSFWLLLGKKYILISSFLWFFNYNALGISKAFPSCFDFEKVTSWESIAFKIPFKLTLHKTLERKLWFPLKLESFSRWFVSRLRQRRKKQFCNFHKLVVSQLHKRHVNYRLQWTFGDLKYLIKQNIPFCTKALNIFKEEKRNLKL